MILRILQLFDELKEKLQTKQKELDEIIDKTSFLNFKSWKVAEKLARRHNTTNTKRNGKERQRKKTIKIVLNQKKKKKKKEKRKQYNEPMQQAIIP